MRSTRFFLALLFAAATLPAGQTVVWQTDWKTAFTIAKEEHRVVLVDYFSMSCPPSKKMEETVLSKSDVQSRLNDFVILRVDLLPGGPRRSDSNFNNLPPHAVPTFPAFAVYDPDERERFRIPRVEAHAAIRERCQRAVTPQTDMTPQSLLDPRPMTFREGPICCDVVVADAFSQWLDTVRGAAPSFARAAEMIDSGKELEADLLLANTYAHFHEFGYASEMYERAQGLAEKSGDKATAQVLQMQSVFLVARDGDPSRAIKLLQSIAAAPVNQQNEALIWLTLGHAYQLAKDQKAARDAYQHALSLAAPESRAYKEANAALSKLQ